MRHTTCLLLLASLLLPIAVIAADDKGGAGDGVSIGEMLRADQFDRIEELFGAKLKQYDPKAANSYLPLSYLINSAGFSADLEAHYDKWVAARPNSYFARLMRGDFHVEYSRAAYGNPFGSDASPRARQESETHISRASADFEKAAQLNPALPFAYSRLIMIDISMDRGQETAAGHLIAARQADPSYYPAYAAYMTLLSPRWGGNYSSMQEFVESNAGRIRGSNLPLLWLVYHAEMALKSNEGPSWWEKPEHWKQVKDAFQSVVKLQPNPIPERCSFAMLADQANQVGDLREQLDLIGPYWGEFMPDSAQRNVFDYVARAWPKTNPNEWMIERAGAELKKNARAARPMMMRGIAYCRAKQYEKAIEDLTRAMELNADLVHGWKELAESYSRTNQNQKAIDAAEKYLYVRPNDAETALVKGNALKAAGRGAEAIAFYRERLGVYPSLVAVWDALTAMLREKYDWPALANACSQALPYANAQNNVPVQFRLYWLRGISNQQMGQYPQAFNDYVEALKRDDGETTINKFAEIYRAGGSWAAFKERVPLLVYEHYKAGGSEDKRMKMFEKFRNKINE